MIDLKDFDVTAACDTGSELTVKHPTTGEPLDIVIRLAGPDSKRVRDADRAIVDQMQALAQDNNLKSDDETLEQFAAAKAAGITLAWEGVQWNGKPFPFTPENATKLYREHRWIREQVERFAASRVNFFKPSKPISAAA